MRQDRSPEMIQVAYYFGRYDARRRDEDSTVPPELRRLGVTSRRQALELFRQSVGDGRSEVTFKGSIDGDIRYFGGRLRKGKALGDSRLIPVGALIDASDQELWEVIRTYLDPSILGRDVQQPIPPALSDGIDRQPNHGSTKPPVPPPATTFALPEEVPPGSTVIEGAVRTVIVNAYERDPEARRQCIAAHGTVCCVCRFSFVARYGEVAEGYIHVHHLRPLSEVGGAHLVDPVKDLRPVCPNCHAVIHRRVPAFSIEEVRKFLR